jgi:ubiquinone/menaquinone biosynthesis C-methylase UbiE
MGTTVTQEETMTTKAYKGLPMEGAIATWYARNTGRDMSRFREVARSVAECVRPGGAVLEVAPGPGYLSIEIARRGYAVTALDISKSFVRIAAENAAREGVEVDVRLGNAAAMPFADASFDFVVCTAAFKNFSDPVAAINEMHRVLKPGGEALIIDLRKDASLRDVADEVRNMHLSAWNALVTRFVFRHGLLRAAYTADQLTEMAERSAFRGGQITPSGIGFELRLTKDR